GTDYLDTDGDLVPDYVETTYQPNNGGTATNANDANDFTDTDNGGVPDYVETVLYPNLGMPATDPNNAADDDNNNDGDTLTNYEELVGGSDLNDPCDPVPCDAVITAKVFLGGAYNDGTGLMHDDLRVKGLIPLAQPYNALTDFNYNGTETVNASVFTTTGPNAIVDWVFVELRDQNDPKVSLYKRAGLLQRDGDIVDLDGVSSLTFTGAGVNNYYVSVRHRNHLGVMTQAPVAFGVTPPAVDFTLGTTLNYQLSGPTGSAYAQQLWPSNKLSLWPGNMSNQPAAPDPHTGDRVIYQGPAADVEDAYFAVLLDPANTSFLPVHVVDPIYSRADANMDGKVIYQGSNADPDVTFFTVFLFPDNTSVLPIFKVFEQIPK
ncbi:MAG: hypothetical protein L6Q97_20445, partial [Thermoanaerobaculia bacterium]|nr:hypothetical protein [Thermoanaerobaculia bacterium]